MKEISARLVGVELYFDDLDLARTFYTETLGLKVSDEQEGHFTKFDSGAGFEPGWAVVHDPEGHNVLLLQGK
jgi:catechol 2,3-dioxygenase-like lactoylglutathione lyase family enzyme